VISGGKETKKTARKGRPMCEPSDVSNKRRAKEGQALLDATENISFSQQHNTKNEPNLCLELANASESGHTAKIDHTNTIKMKRSANPKKRCIQQILFSADAGFQGPVKRSLEHDQRVSDYPTFDLHMPMLNTHACRSLCGRHSRCETPNRPPMPPTLTNFGQAQIAAHGNNGIVLAGDACVRQRQSPLWVARL
jgi:hypothetical protein